MEIIRSDRKINKSYTIIYKDDIYSFSGHYICSKGIVIINHRWYDGRYNTLFRFFYHGRLYRKQILNRPYTKIGLARKAGEFVKEVVYETEDT